VPSWLLSPRDVDYLMVVYHLAHSRGIARISDVAKYLGVAKPTASLMLKKLMKLGLLRRVDGGYALTEEGLSICTDMFIKHTIIETALSRLGLDPDEACQLAREIEVLMPMDKAMKIWESIGRPERCPHSDPIRCAVPPPSSCRVRLVARIK